MAEETRALGGRRKPTTSGTRGMGRGASRQVLVSFFCSRSLGGYEEKGGPSTRSGCLLPRGLWVGARTQECCCQRLPRRPPYFCNFWKHPGERPRGFLDRKFGDSVGDASMIAILFLPVLLSSSNNSRVDLKKEKTQKGKTHRRWWPLPVLILGGYAFHKVNPPSCREP